MASPTPRRRSPATPPLTHAEAVAYLTAGTPLPPPLSRPSSPPQPPKGTHSDPILRNALRYTISAREYSALHKYLLSRSPALARTTPTPARVEQIVGSDAPRRHKDRENDRGLVDGEEQEEAVEEENDYNARAVRHSMRVFVLSGMVMKIWDLLLVKLGKKKETPAGKKQPLYKSANFRLSVSLSTILLLYRLLFRFFTRLRGHLLEASAAPFRRRNPRTTAALTSPYTPAVGASFAGLMLGITPVYHMRVTVAMYALFRAMEFAWNSLENDGMIWGFKTLASGLKIRKERPWWFGSWIMHPFMYGQLLHAKVYEPDCLPKDFGIDWLFKQSSTYLQKRPDGYGIGLPWPSTFEILDSLGSMSKLNWPTYVSPTLFPKKDVLPASLSAIAPLTARANPLIKSLSCATLHPHDPSCMRTYMTFWLQSFPPIAKTLFAVCSAMSVVPRFWDLSAAPMKFLWGLVLRSLKLSTIMTGALSSAWASICFFQKWFPRTFLARQRFFLNGFIGGLWSFLDRKNGSGILNPMKMSVDSFWRVGVKRRWWRGIKGGDVWLFVLALMVSSVVYEKDARAVKEKNWRKGISWLRGEGFQDWSIQLTEEEEERKREEEEAERVYERD